jgi:hypothetical protein
MQRIANRSVVSGERYPTEVAYRAAPLQPGGFVAFLCLPCVHNARW